MLTPASNLLSYILPAGMIAPFAGSTAPAKWLLCDGSAVSRTTYSALFNAIGTTWGTGDGSTTFNVPDGRGRTLVGVGTATGANGATAHTLGQKAGEETHTMTTGELVSHNHALTDPGHYHQEQIATTGSGGTGITGTAGLSGNTGATQDTGSKFTGITLANTGSTTPFNLMQPYLGANFIIKT